MNPTPHAVLCSKCHRLIKGPGLKKYNDLLRDHNGVINGMLLSGDLVVIEGKAYHNPCGMQVFNGQNAAKREEIKASAPKPVEHMSVSEPDVKMDNLSNEDWMALQHARMTERKEEGRARPVPKEHVTVRK